MIEAEVKLKIHSAEETEKKLLEMGFHYQASIYQKDSYFDTVDGKIRLGGEALRIRTIKDLSSAGTTQVFITFKGQKLDTVSMTRQELETEVKDGQVLEEILGALGYHAVPPSVMKIRKEYALSDAEFGEIHAVIDTVEGLGGFLELEILTEEQSREEALNRISILLEQLDYSLADTTTNSYLSMLQGVED
ncbi:MAG: class IV adenylate cyclase [Lachnospiraceae bacterium]|nr:class IV adenylate cyclase [Lachnospiraceae bacterium]